MAKVGDQNKQTSDKSCCMTEEGQQKLQDAIRSRGGKYIKGEGNLNYSAIATASKLNRGTVKNILEGHKNLTRSSIERLGNFLGLNLEEDVDFECIDSDSFSIEKSNDNYSSLLITTNTPTAFDLLGRDADRQKLAELSQKHKLVLLKAAAGIGKSTLARHFLETQFTKVIRLEMGLESGNVTPAEEKVSQILRKEFDEEPSRDFQTNLEILREKLSDKSRPIGVLIDNLEPALDANFRFLEKLRGYEDLLRILGDRDICSFTLITSRRSLIVQRVKVHEYSLQGLDIEAWREYFDDCENGATSEDLEEMCVAYNGNAKVMDILHGAITNRFDSNIAAYWNRYKDALLADAELETLISVEMDWLRDNQPDVYKLLCRMGCYRYQDVKTVPFEGLICLLWDVPESRKACVVDYLSKSSLIEVKGEYYLHPAIRYACNCQLLENPSEWEATNLIVADFWTKCVEMIESGDDALKAFEAYHHYKLTDKKNLAGEVLVYERKNLWAENSPLGASLYRLGWLDTLISSITDIMSSIEPNYTLSRLYNILGDTYWMTGKIHQAILHHHQSREVAVIYRKENFDLPQNIKSRLRRCEVASILNIGLCQIDLWELEKAIDLLEEIVEIAIPEHDEDYYFYEPINNAFFCLAFLYSELHFFDKANEFIERSKKITNIKTQTEWARGNRLIFLGHAYKNIGILDYAIDSFERTLDFAKDSNYPQSKGKALVGLATTLRVRTNLSDVVSLYYEAIDTLKPIGAKCDLAEAYFQLGLTYQEMGKYGEAEIYKAKALKLFEQMEAPKQIERVNQAFEQGAKQ
jgi:tetratricopeptide (TPR) repeat protein